MQEPWVIGLAVFALLVIWIAWQTIENTLFCGLFGVVFTAIEKAWKKFKSLPRRRS